MRSKVTLPKVYIFIIVLFVLAGFNTYVGYTSFIDSFTGEEGWACVNYQCTEFRSGEEWAQDNCFTTNDGQEVCRINIDGQTQFVPKANINLANLQECIKSECTQEVKTRTIE